jgi:hypothetical protein
MDVKWIRLLIVDEMELENGEIHVYIYTYYMYTCIYIHVYVYICIYVVYFGILVRIVKLLDWFGFGEMWFRLVIIAKWNLGTYIYTTYVYVFVKLEMVTSLVIFVVL